MATSASTCSPNNWFNSNFPNQTNVCLCTISVLAVVPSLLWVYFGGHATNGGNGGGLYGYISIDNDVTGIADYARCRATYNTVVNNPGDFWNNLNSGRIVSVPPGIHAVSMCVYSTEMSSDLNGAGLQAAAIPMDPTLPYGAQLFSCTLSGTNTVAAWSRADYLCNTTVTLPYSAVVWVQFSASSLLLSPSQWIMGGIDIDGDFIAASSASDSSLVMNYGPAYMTMSGSYVPFGQGRSAILNAGSHIIGVAAIASRAGVAQLANVGMDGFFVPN
jgi:hypothetical protein